MSSAPNPAVVDYDEHLARIRRSNEETEKFVSEQKRLMAEAAERDRTWTSTFPLVAVSSLAAGAAFFGAGMVFAKLLGL